MSRWFVVERGTHCIFGHEIAPGEWARWSLWNEGMAQCAECLERGYRIVRPVDATADSRQRAAGE